MEETKETPTTDEKKNEKEEAPRYEVVIVDTFKMLLGYNKHVYGAKRKTL
jgi:hypothetical protein